jgi:uncharacterized protein (TIGR00266 family)
MEHSINGRPSFAHINVKLAPGEEIMTESGAMASMQSALTHKAETNGGIVQAALKRFLGKESFFINRFINYTDKPLELTLTQGVPGDIKAIELNGKGGFYAQPGAYIASTPGIQVTMKYAGFRSWFAREGLFRLFINGHGTVWIGALGHVYAKDIDGEYLIDTSHLVAYTPSLNLDVQLSGGLISSITSGEGFVTRMSGTGKIYLQSRSMSGLATYMNSRI